MLNVGKRRVERAREVLDRGEPGLVRVVERGDIPVSVAADLTKASPEAQRRAVADPEKAAGVAKLRAAFFRLSRAFGACGLYG